MEIGIYIPTADALTKGFFDEYVNDPIIACRTASSSRVAGCSVWLIPVQVSGQVAVMPSMAFWQK